MNSTATEPNPSPTLRTIYAYLAAETERDPLGVRIVEPRPDTKQAVRGNLYAVVDISGDDAERQRMSERLLSVLQRTYYTTKGSQSVVLLEAMQHARKMLQAYNAEHADAPLRASITCATLLRQRMLVSCSGSALAIVRRGSRVELFPQTLNDLLTDSEQHSAPDVLRWDLAAGDALLLAGSGWADRVPMRTLAATIAYVDAETCEDAAEGLREQAGALELPGMLLVLADNEQPSAQPKPTIPFGAARRPSAGALPTSLNAGPPVTGVPRTDASAAEPAPQRPARPEHLQEEDRPAESYASTTVDTAGSSGALPAVGSVLAGVWRRVRAAAATVLPEPRSRRPLAPEAAHEDEDDRRTSSTVSEWRPDVAIDESSAAPEPFVPPPPARGSRARTLVLLALIIALLVPVTVIVVSAQRAANDRAQAESLVTLAQARFSSAQEALDADDKPVALSNLTEASEYLKSAETILGRTATIDDLDVRTRRMLQEVLQVQPLYELTSPLIQFPAGSQPTRVIVVDQDIYVLDAGRQLVERYRLDQSFEYVADETGEVVLRQGSVIDGATVGQLLDMAWQLPVPGFDDKPSLLVLDSAAHVFRYDQRVEGASLLKVSGQETWKDVPQIETYQGRLYVANLDSGQVYRYSAGQYDAEPSAWFQQPVNLKDMLTMRIDGDIWLLLTNGQVLRYFQGVQVPFSLDNSVGLIDQPIDFFVGDESNPYIYMADRKGESVWIFDKNGQYVKQLAAAEGNPLAGLHGLFIDDVTDSMYLFTDTALFKHPLVQN